MKFISYLQLYHISIPGNAIFCFNTKLENDMRREFNTPLHPRYGT